MTQLLASPASSPVQRYRHPRAVLVVMCLIALISVAGLSLPYPILAPLFAGSELNSLNHWQGFEPTLLLGIALAANPLGILLGSAVLGALSDVLGRRRVLSASLAMALLGYLLSAWALYQQNYPLFVLSRLFTGLCEGAVSICRAFAADLHPVIDRSVSISWMNSALYAAWLVGPLLGGLTMHLGAYVPFLIAAFIMLPCLVLLWWLIPADAAQTVAPPSLWATIRAHNSFQMLGFKPLRYLVLAQLIYTTGLNAFYEFYPLFLVQYEQFDGAAIGYITALLCLLMTSVSALVMARWGQRFNPLPAAIAAALLFVLLLALLPLHSGLWCWLLLVLCGLPIPMVSSWFQVYCTATFGSLGMGRIMGLLTFLMCSGNFVIALLGAYIAQWDVRWTLWFGALCILLSVGCLYAEYRQRRQPLPASCTGVQTL